MPGEFAERSLAMRYGDWPQRRPICTRICPRYRQSTQPTVTKLADDIGRATNVTPTKATFDLDKRLRADLRRMGDFSRIYPLPGSSADVPDRP